MDKNKILISHIQDNRSKKVVFLSHCILNENTRYLGGACRECCVSEIIIKCIKNNVGIIQMPCPEQHAWGGVYKRLLLIAYCSKDTLFYSMRFLVMPLLLCSTRLIYWWIARRIAYQVEDYLSSGFTVLGVIGIDGSPSCGVNKTLDIRKAFDQVAHMEINSITAEKVNKAIECLVAGTGIFTHALQKQLKNRKIHVPYIAHDLMTEFEGYPSNVISHVNFFCENQKVS